MMVWTHNPRQGFVKDVGTYPNFEDWRRASQSFERMSAYRGASVTLTENADRAQIRGARVTHEFFETMGVVPLQGRAFSSANGQAGGYPTELWGPRSEPSIPALVQPLMEEPD